MCEVSKDALKLQQAGSQNCLTEIKYQEIQSYLNNLVSFFFFFVFGRIEMSLPELLLFVQHGWTIQCDRDSGPSGATGFLHISRYNNQYQWTTCVTNAYIEQKKKAKNTNVMIALKPVTGTSVCSRCTIKAVVS